SALVAVIRALVKPGGIVAFPAYGCTDLTSAAVRAGVRVRLYDLSPATLSPNLDSLRRAARRGVDGVVVTHLYGYPADLNAVQEIGTEFGIPIIEDAAQAAGGKLHGVRLGALGDVSILSFGRGKGLAAGSGGAILMRNGFERSHGDGLRLSVAPPKRGGFEVVSLAAQWVLARPALYGIPSSIPALRLGETVYKPAHEPHSISTMAAAILPGAIKMDFDETRTRQARAAAILSTLTRSARIDPVKPVAGGEPGYLRLAVLDPGGAISPNVRLGAVRGYPMTLDQHPQLHSLLEPGESAGSGSSLLRDRLLTLPTHSRVRSIDILRITMWAKAQQPEASAVAWVPT
ncbi:MAG TPA: DegT/DnrJ/EryC1/StrS family aminotransferase, partial [Gemmatimonadaceae bacterium]|nr:DegT/DnrJ/EryC1/StrS family aminotransferase [Gemmatimonadaceae bacterium]